MRTAIIENGAVANIIIGSIPGMECVSIPDDQFVDIGYLCDGTNFSAPPVPAPTFTQLEAVIQSQLDTLAQSWGYMDMADAVTYVNSAVQKFKDEANALMAWRDQTWFQSETLAAQIEAGTAQMPATVSAALALMPATPARPAN